MGHPPNAMLAPGFATVPLPPSIRERVWSAPAGSPADQGQPPRAKCRLRWMTKPPIMDRMEWTTPAYEELKMDAEIGSYQVDEEPPPFVEAPADAE